jgi:hypothetical protein
MKKINDLTFGNVVNEYTKPIVIKFYNTKCPLCAGIKPIFQQLSQMYDNYEFAECNAANSNRVFKFFNISGVPSVFILGPNFMKEIPYPQNPDPHSGYSLYDIADFLDSFTPPT